MSNGQVGKAPLLEGTLAELEQFAEICARIERTGGWAELSSELKQETIKLSTDHCRELDNYAWSLGKGFASIGSPAATDGSPSSPGSSPAVGPSEDLIGALLEAPIVTNGASPGQRS